MFVAMMAALPIYYGFLICSKTPLPNVPQRMWFILSAPACTDMLGTMFAMIGLQYVTVSVYQLVRCLVIVFVALLKVCVNGKNLEGYKWLGVFLIAFSVVVVSVSSLESGADEDQSMAMVGITCIISGCAIMASQFVIEEWAMNEGKKSGEQQQLQGAAPVEVPPLVIVGMEGFWGTLIMLCIIYPIAYIAPGNDHGSYENFYESCIGIWNNPDLFAVAMGYLCAITTYNVSAIFITSLLESVWRSILENFRPIAVWGADLFLFYAVTGGSFGEAWTSPGSYVEAAGLCVLILGTMVYNANVRIPGLQYPDAGEEVEVATDMTRSPFRSPRHFPGSKDREYQRVQNVEINMPSTSYGGITRKTQYSEV